MAAQIWAKKDLSATGSNDARRNREEQEQPLSKLKGIKPNQTTWVILGIILAFMISALMTMSILANLNALENQRIKTYRDAAQQLTEMVKNFMLRKQYGELDDLMKIQIQASDVQYMAVYVNRENVLNAGTLPAVTLPEFPAATEDDLFQKKIDNLFLYFETKLPGAGGINASRKLVILYVLQAFESRRRMIIIFMAILAGFISILILTVYKLHRTQVKLHQEETNRTNMIEAISHDALHYVSIIKIILGNRLDHLKAKVNGALPRENIFEILEYNDSLTKLLENLKFNDYLKRGIVKNSAVRLEWIKLVESSINSFRYMLLKKNVSLQFNRHGGQLFTYIDRDLAKRIILNLLHNAFKYTRWNSQITVTVTEQDSRIMTRIQDQGSGIARQDWETVFLPSVRLKNDHFVRPEDRRGTGLGLSNARQFVDLFGGELKIVSSRLNEGTIFEITLPKAD